MFTNAETVKITGVSSKQIQNWSTRIPDWEIGEIQRTGRKLYSGSDIFLLSLVGSLVNKIGLTPIDAHRIVVPYFLDPVAEFISAIYQDGNADNHLSDFLSDAYTSYNFVVSFDENSEVRVSKKWKNSAIKYTPHSDKRPMHKDGDTYIEIPLIYLIIEKINLMQEIYDSDIK